MNTLASAEFWFGASAGFFTAVILFVGLRLLMDVDLTLMERRPIPYSTDEYEPIAADEYDAEIVEGVAV